MASAAKGDLQPCLRSRRDSGHDPYYSPQDLRYQCCLSSRTRGCNSMPESPEQLLWAPQAYSLGGTHASELLTEISLGGSSLLPPGFTGALSQARRNACACSEVWRYAKRATWRPTSFRRFSKARSVKAPD